MAYSGTQHLGFMRTMKQQSHSGMLLPRQGIPSRAKNAAPISAFLRSVMPPKQKDVTGSSSSKLTLNTRHLLPGRRQRQQLQEADGEDSVLPSSGAIAPDPLSQRIGRRHEPRLSAASAKSRKKVLKAIVDNLRARRRRTQSSEPNSSDGVDVELTLEGNDSPSDFAGTLALLLESGDQEPQVLSVGAAFLANRPKTEGGGGGKGGKEGAAAAAAVGSVALNDDGGASLTHPQALQDVVRCMALAHRHLALGALSASASAFSPLAPSSPLIYPPELLSPAASSTIPTSSSSSSSSSYLAVAHFHLRSALDLLRNPRSPNSTDGALQREIRDLLVSITPRYVHDLLAFRPESINMGLMGNKGEKDGTRQRREKALEALKYALWGPSPYHLMPPSPSIPSAASSLGGRVMGLPPLRPAERQAAVSQVRQLLTAEEQTALYEEGSPILDTDLGESEVYDLALAHIWQGYTKRWPHHIYRADTLLELISQRTDLGLDVDLERSVCALLLGKDFEEGAGGEGMEEEERSLGQHTSNEEEEGGRGDGKEALAYRREGLQSLAQLWLDTSVVPAFQGGSGGGSGGSLDGGGGGGAGSSSSSRATSLKAYLGSPKVAVFNQVLKGASERNLRQVQASLASTSSGALQQLMGVWTSTTAALMQQGNKAAASAAVEVKVEGLVEAERMEGDAAAAAAAVAEAAAVASLDQELEASALFLTTSWSSVSDDDTDPAASPSTPLAPNPSLPTPQGAGVPTAAFPAAPSSSSPSSPPLWIEVKDVAIRPRISARIVDPTRKDASMVMGGDLAAAEESSLLTLVLKMGLVAGMGVAVWMGLPLLLQGRLGQQLGSSSADPFFMGSKERMTWLVERPGQGQSQGKTEKKKKKGQDAKKRGGEGSVSSGKIVV